MLDIEQASRLPEAVRSIIEARTGDAVFVVAPDYHIAYWDEEAQFLTGSSPEEMVGSPCYRAVLGEKESGEPFCGYGCSVMRLAQAGRPVASYDMKVRTGSGTKRWVSVSVLSVASEEGPYLVHLLRDSQKAHETIEFARGLIQLTKKDHADTADAPSPPRHETPALTGRQLEVLGLLAKGKSTGEIAGELYLAKATVRNHIRALLQALGVHSQLEALAKAREVGLLSD